MCVCRIIPFDIKMRADKSRFLLIEKTKIDVMMKRIIFQLPKKLQNYRNPAAVVVCTRRSRYGVEMRADDNFFIAASQMNDDVVSGNGIKLSPEERTVSKGMEV